jgi:hypothetical protein
MQYAFACNKIVPYLFQGKQLSWWVFFAIKGNNLGKKCASGLCRRKPPYVEGKA